ncbi:MAG TPA: trehalose-6-phosphate synthase, partial [Xanthobacteraceae bacterium]
MSLVVVSNRVAPTQANEPMTGGLASALLPVVRDSGAIWIGSSCRLCDDPYKESFAEIESLGAGAIATVDFPAAHYPGFYEGFSNSALWPALHSRPDLIRVTDDDYKSYRAINAFMARALLRFNTPEAIFWIQDYHFLILGAELRRLGIERPLGFFLHTPWADRRTVTAVPHHGEIARAMLAYD